MLVIVARCVRAERSLLLKGQVLQLGLVRIVLRSWWGDLAHLILLGGCEVMLG